MTTTLLTSSGSTVNCWVEKITEVKQQRTVITDNPTATGDFIQNLGTKCRTFNITGGVTGSDGVSQLRSLPGTTGSLTFTGFYGGDMIPQAHIFYIDMNFDDTEAEPTLRGFKLSAVEVI